MAALSNAAYYQVKQRNQNVSLQKTNVPKQMGLVALLRLIAQQITGSAFKFLA